MISTDERKKVSNLSIFPLTNQAGENNISGVVTKEEISRAARILGSAKSEAKTAAVRENGKKGGRPGDPRVKRIMKERGVTRQRAHQILQERAKPSAQR